MNVHTCWAPFLLSTRGFLLKKSGLKNSFWTDQLRGFPTETFFISSLGLFLRYSVPFFASPQISWCLSALPSEALGPHSPSSLNLPADGTHQGKFCTSAQKNHHLRSRNSVLFIQVVFIQVGQSTWAVITLIMDWQKRKTHYLAEKLSSQKYSCQMGGGYNKPLGRTILVLESSTDFEPYPKGMRPTPKSHWQELCSRELNQVHSLEKIAG